MDRTLHLQVDVAGQRLDRYLVQSVPGVSRSQLQRLIRQGLVTLDGRAARPSTPVEPGMRVTVHLPSLSIPVIAPEPLALDIVYEDDDLLVEDGYSTAPPRAITMLSGGETFLASLALALSVKDFLSRNRQLNSFFIDEGFSTLDAQTLQEVADVLETLKSENLQIGIITHRQDLVARFERVLQVVNDNGCSRLLPEGAAV